MQIYIPVWLDQKFNFNDEEILRTDKFTFQYGQIRNDEGKRK